MEGSDVTDRTRVAADIGGIFTELALSLPAGTLSKKLLARPRRTDLDESM